MDATFERGRLLYDGKQYDRALREFQQQLAQSPHDCAANAYVALCQMHRRRLGHAAEAARLAVEADAENPFAWYVLAFVERRRRHFDDAAKAIARAQEVAPQEAEYRGFGAEVRQARFAWAEALKLAEQGLDLDPENRTCALARARSLVRLGQAGEARASLQARLARDPEDPLSLAHLGWTALDQGDRRAALTAFRDALRADPELLWARDGLVEALRAGVPLYGFLLRYHLAMQGLSEDDRVALAIGESYLTQIITAIGCATVILFPLTLVYLTVRSVLVYLTWALRPVTGLFLLTHPFGRYCLERHERREALWAVPAVGAVVGSLGMAVVHRSPGWAAAILVAAYAVSSVGAVFHVPPGGARWAVALAALLLLGLGVLSVARLVRSPWDWPGWILLVIFVWARSLVTLLATLLGYVVEDRARA